MSSNVMPGRFRDRIEILEKSQDSDDWGIPATPTSVVKLKGNVVERSGDQLSKYGTELTSKIITVLTYRRDTVKAGQQLVWKNRGGDLVYEILHVKPADNRFKYMIVTAEVEKHEGNNQL